MATSDIHIGIITIQSLEFSRNTFYHAGRALGTHRAVVGIPSSQWPAFHMT
jgi:hypothetical protein